MRLDKVTALVTGASSGIGEAVTSRFRREGARLLLTGRREHLESAAPDDLYVAGDMNDEAFVAGLAAQAAETFGSLDVVVVNHGLQVSGPLTEMAYDDARNVLHSNLLSAFLVLKHFAPLMPASGGSFVCVGSRLGMVGKPEEVMYSAAKGGLIMLAKGAAIEWAPRNIRVNVVAPGTDLHPDHRGVVPTQARPRGLSSRARGPDPAPAPRHPRRDRRRHLVPRILGVVLHHRSGPPRGRGLHRLLTLCDCSRGSAGIDRGQVGADHSSVRDQPEE